ncbi:hypothetical protein ACOMHN_026238 [Nucella lapillus]
MAPGRMHEDARRAFAKPSALPSCARGLVGTPGGDHCCPLPVVVPVAGETAPAPLLSLELFSSLLVMNSSSGSRGKKTRSVNMNSFVPTPCSATSFTSAVCL